MSFIGRNETRYSTEDLERLSELVYQDLKGGGEWRGHHLVVRTDSLPLALAYWRGAEAQVEEPRRLGTGNYTSNYWELVEGPWFTSEKRNGGGSLHVLSPARLSGHLNPMEALATVGAEVPVLPRAAIAQLLYAILSAAGVVMALSSPSDAHHSKVLLYRLAQEYSKGTPPVRILKNREDRPVKLTDEESTQRALALYTGGQSARDLRWKRWTIRDRAAEHFECWQRLEKHRRRLEVAGRAFDPHMPTGDYLRKLADEYDQLIGEDDDA